MADKGRERGGEERRREEMEQTLEAGMVSNGRREERLHMLEK